MTCWHIYSKIKITFYIARDGYFLTPLARTLCTVSTSVFILGTVHSTVMRIDYCAQRCIVDQTPKKKCSVRDRFTTPRVVRVGV